MCINLLIRASGLGDLVLSLPVNNVSYVSRWSAGIRLWALIKPKYPKKSLDLKDVHKHNSYLSQLPRLPVYNIFFNKEDGERDINILFSCIRSRQSDALNYKIWVPFILHFFFLPCSSVFIVLDLEFLPRSKTKVSESYPPRKMMLFTAGVSRRDVLQFSGWIGTVFLYILSISFMYSN